MASPSVPFSVLEAVMKATDRVIKATRMAFLKAELASLEADMESLKAHMESLKAHTAYLEADMATLEPRSRKCQAVGECRSKKTIATIKRNSSESPLLSLPAELRDNVWRLVLGDQLVHLTSYDPYARCKPSERIIQHRFCTSSHTEDAAYQDFVKGYGSIPAGHSAEYYSDTYSDRHADCIQLRADGKGFANQAHLRSDLQLLGASRQIYEEAHHVLLSTNTFAFSDPAAFLAFVACTNGAQRRKITSLLFSTNGVLQITEFTSYITPNVVRSFTGLHTLHFRFDHKQLNNYTIKNGSNALSDLGTHPNPLERPFASLRLRALRHVTIIVGERDICETDSANRAALSLRYRCTLKMKRQIADALREDFLGANSLAKFQIDLSKWDLLSTKEKKNSIDLWNFDHHGFYEFFDWLHSPNWL